MSPADKILQKALVASDINSREWTKIQAALRDRAFFSSQVNEAKILHAMRQNVADFASGKKSASEVRRDLREYLDSTGYDPGDKKGTIKDLTTKARLDVIMRTNADQAKGYASHIRATSAGAILAFPAYELVRVEKRNMPRDWHARWMRAAAEVNYLGVSHGTRMIALKTSPIWVQISAFHNPFPPFDFNSGMGVRDVSKSYCREIGLLGEHEQPEIPDVPDFNGNLQAQIPMQDDSPEAIKLKRIFGDQIAISNGVAQWQSSLIDDVATGRRQSASLGQSTNGEALTLTPGSMSSISPSDRALIPSLWRAPDRSSRNADGSRTLELDLIGGAILRMVVNNDTILNLSKIVKP